MPGPLISQPPHADATIRSGPLPCLLAGTKIMTKLGDRMIERLRPGDMVLTRDGGFVPIRWVGSVVANARGPEFSANAPVCIPKGAIAPGLPERDLYVAPDHRIWMQDSTFEVYFDETEVLIPARLLIGWHGIQQVSFIPEPEYFHLLFDHHEIILSDGLQTESFHPGQVALGGFATGARDELLRLFPDLLDLCSRGRTARRCLRDHEVPIALKAKSAA